MNQIYPLGYSTLGSQEYLDGLLSDPKALLIDTRISPRSWRSDWCKEALEQRYGDRYRWAGKYLGNENYQGGPIKLANPVVGVKGLIRYLNEQHDLILLCQCKTFSSCHMSTICNLLVEEMPEVEVVRFDEEQEQVTMSSPSTSSSIQEWRYSVSDVVFEDVGDTPVPDKYKALYAEYCAEIDILPVNTPMWRSAMYEYKNVILEKNRHKAYTKSLLCSGDPKAMLAAEQAMLCQLDKYCESQQHKEHMQECRKNLEKARKEGRKWTVTA